MAATYDLTTNVGKVRLIIGDTDVAPATDAAFTDGEITVFLTLNSSNLNLTAADLMEAWAAKYGASADSEKIGDYAYTHKIVDKMLKTAERLREKAFNVPSGAVAEQALTDFSARDIILNRDMRSG